jgi:hypothetical protein
MPLVVNNAKRYHAAVTSYTLLPMLILCRTHLLPNTTTPSTTIPAVSPRTKEQQTDDGER